MYGVSFLSEKDGGKKEPEILARYYISSADLTAEKKDEKSSDGQRVPRVGPCGVS